MTTGRRAVRILLDADYIVYKIGFACQQAQYLVTEGVEQEPGVINTELLGEWTTKTEMGADLEQLERSLDEENIRLWERIEVAPEAHAFHSLNVHIETICDRICEKFGIDRYNLEVYLTGPGNYREQVATIKPYKGNRKAPKPVLYEKLREFMVDRWDGKVIEGQEADDEVAIRQTDCARDGEESIIVTIDKDLLQVPGWHFNPDKGFMQINETQGLRRFFKQVLTGDTADNIPGCFRVGAKKAEELLKGKRAASSMWKIALEQYNEALSKYGSEKCGYSDPEAAAIENAILLWMRRTPGEVWAPPA